MPAAAKSPRPAPPPEKHKVTCPVCRKKVPLAPDGRCEACSSLLFSPHLLQDGVRPWPVPVRAFVDLVTNQALARVLAARSPNGALLLEAFALIVGALSLLAGGPEVLWQWSMGWPWALGGESGAFVFAFLVGPALGLGLVANLVLNAFVLIKRAGLPSLDGLAAGLVPVVDARFQPMGFRGKRAMVVYVTFRVELLEPSTRVALYVGLETPEGKPLGARLPRYRAPDGEFLLRELGAPIGRPSDGVFTLGALLPLTVMVLPGVAGQAQRLVARIELRIDERVEATQRLVAELTPTAADFPAPPRPRAEPGAVAEVESESVSIEIVAVTATTEGGCPVCGEGLSRPVQRCTACDTPHHPECWAFAGRCSTYACEGSPRMAE